MESVSIAVALFRHVHSCSSILTTFGQCEEPAFLSNSSEEERGQRQWEVKHLRHKQKTAQIPQLGFKPCTLNNYGWCSRPLEWLCDFPPLCVTAKSFLPSFPPSFLSLTFDLYPHYTIPNTSKTLIERGRERARITRSSLWQDVECRRTCLTKRCEDTWA